MTRNNFDDIQPKMSRQEISHLGGIAAIKKRGNPGTFEGRKKGGLNSQKVQQQLQSGFKLRKKIQKAKHSVLLAEFIGIMLGDGHLGKYQISVTTSSVTDVQHAQYVAQIITKLFSIKATIQKKKTSNALVIVASSYELCRFLEECGLLTGNKITNGVKVPLWIRDNPNYAKACARGLFDTDGSVYCDSHTIRGVGYKHVGMTFVNCNEDILAFFKSLLEQCGLHPTQKTRYRVFLRRKKDIEQYAVLIGFSNQKHSNRYNTFKQIVGRVA